MTESALSKRRLSPGAWLLLFLNLLLLSGQVGFGKQAALMQRGEAIHLFFLNPFYFASMACLVLQSVIWPLVLKRVPLGFAYGINSLNYVSMLAVGHCFFSERITMNNLLGAALIMAGVCIWAANLRSIP